MLFAGEKWDPAIRREMKRSVAVVFLVSPYMLDSKYVREVEIPEFLALTDKFGLQVFCLYVDHSVADMVEFNVKTKLGNSISKLTDFQALNPPNQPLSERTKKDRNKVLADAAKKVFSAVRSKPMQVMVGVVDRSPKIGTKTIHVAIERRVPHPRYNKVQEKTTKLAVHWDETQPIAKGDKVEIMETRPISKTKHHVLVRKVDD